jgi:hypothetical protein
MDLADDDKAMVGTLTLVRDAQSTLSSMLVGMEMRMRVDFA